MDYETQLKKLADAHLAYRKDHPETDVLFDSVMTAFEEDLDENLRKSGSSKARFTEIASRLHELKSQTYSLSETSCMILGYLDRLERQYPQEVSRRFPLLLDNMNRLYDNCIEKQETMEEADQEESRDYQTEELRADLLGMLVQAAQAAARETGMPEEELELWETIQDQCRGIDDSYAEIQDWLQFLGDSIASSRPAEHSQSGPTVSLTDDEEEAFFHHAMDWLQEKLEQTYSQDPVLGSLVEPVITSVEAYIDHSDPETGPVAQFAGQMIMLREIADTECKELMDLLGFIRRLESREPEALPHKKARALLAFCQKSEPEPESEGRLSDPDLVDEQETDGLSSAKSVLIQDARELAESGQRGRRAQEKWADLTGEIQVTSILMHDLGAWLDEVMDGLMGLDPETDIDD